jgi:hypothetical protein
MTMTPPSDPRMPAKITCILYGVGFALALTVLVRGAV